MNTFVRGILGLVSEKENNGNNLTNEVMEIVLKLRGNAKNNKDFDTADLIREELDKIYGQLSTKWEKMHQKQSKREQALKEYREANPSLFS